MQTMQHTVLSESQHPAGVFLETFVRLRKRGIVPAVLHPAVEPPSEQALAEMRATWRAELDVGLAGFVAGKRLFLSINRFERKKVCTFPKICSLKIAYMACADG